MRGGWRGAIGTVGGIPRTYGLQRHFTQPERERSSQGITRASLRRIAGYFRPYLSIWIIVLICVCMTAAIEVLPPLCVGMILDRAIPGGDTNLLALLAVAMVLLAMAAGMLGVLQQSLTARAEQGMMFNIRNQLFRHLQHMSLQFFTSSRSGEIISRMNNDVIAVQSVTTGTVVSISRNFATLLATSIAMFSMNWKLTLVAVAVVPAFYLPSKIVGAISRRLSTDIQNSHAEQLTFMHERLHVGGIILSKIFGRREADADSFSQHTAKLRGLSVRQAVVGRWLFMILSVFSAIGPALIFWYGGYQVIGKELTPGLLVAFAALLTLLYRPMVQLATVYVNVQSSVAVFDRLFEYLDMKPEIEDTPAPASVSDLQGHIVFNDVDFSYPVVQRTETADEADPAKEPVEPFSLRNISFEILPGEQVALVGPSGSGKSTITYLAPRFYDPISGIITLDGLDIREIRQEELRQHIGMVTQETFLFNASLRENLLYAKPDATDDEIMEASRAANIHDFISALPDGYNTVVGERGFRLSGGERQRVSIARALLKDPSILILDEATSNLDSTSEYLIQQALDKLLRGRTSLIIAHRLSTILSSDKIVVLDHGRVVEIGKHKDLIAANGLYSRLFHQQFSKVMGIQGM